MVLNYIDYLVIPLLSCLKQNIVFLTHETVIILLFFYKLDIESRDLSSDFTLEAFRFYARI